jgi:hypothetical protein
LSVDYRIADVEPAVRRHLDELCARLTRAFPDADFVVYEGHDPHGVYLAVISDADDGFDVLDAVVDRLVDLLLEDNVAIHVVPAHRTVPDTGSSAGLTRRYRAAALDPAPP